MTLSDDEIFVGDQVTVTCTSVHGIPESVYEYGELQSRSYTSAEGLYQLYLQAGI